MAGDWIKMRGNLWDDPRVANLCDLTEQTEAVIIGGLYWLWAAADQHTEDGLMPGLSLRQIDRKTGIAGFGKALVAIGWLAEDPAGVSLVRFDEHNGESAKRRAADAKRKADVRKMSESLRTNDGQKTDNSGEVAELEKEKEKEKSKEVNQKQKAPAQPPVALPDWLPLGSWNGYLEMRKQKKKVPTAYALELVIKDLTKFHDAGHDVAAILDASTKNGWTDVYAPKVEQQARGSPAGHPTLGKAGQATAAAAQRLLEMMEDE